MRVALVLMPWLAPNLAPLGIASLKSRLRADGHEADAHYLNLRLFARIGELASVMAAQHLWPEWLFAYHLFGPGGSGELREELDDLYAREPFRSYLGRLDVPRPRLEALLRRDLPAFLSECLEEVHWTSYDLIGFSSSFWTHAASLTLARELKRRLPRTPLALGGANVEGEMGLETLRGCGWIDYVVDGEGEDALSGLARNIEAGRPFEPVPRVSFRRGSSVVERAESRPSPVDLDSLPTPDHSDYFAQLELLGLRGRVEPHATFEASRGCWWGQKRQCVFCGFSGEAIGYRSKTASRVLQDVLALRRRYGARSLQACDNIMSVAHARELLPELARARRAEGLDWTIHFQTKANLSDAQMRALSEAGVGCIQPGIESLSTPLLVRMRKGVTALQNIQTLKLAAGRGVDVSWNLLLGLPGEEVEEYARMAGLVPALSHLPPPRGCGRIMLDRFSPYHFDWRRLGTGRPRPHPAYGFLYPAALFAADRIAYHFEFDGAAAGAAGEAPYAALREAVERWRRDRPQSVLVCAREADAVRIYDSRPGLGAAEEYRLEGPAALAFSLCGGIAAEGRIVESCRGAAAALAELEARRLIVREGGRCLNLAVPAARLLGALRRSLAEAFPRPEDRRAWLRAPQAELDGSPLASLRGSLAGLIATRRCLERLRRRGPAGATTPPAPSATP